MNIFVWPPSKTMLYSLSASYDSSPGGTSSDDPVMSLPNCSVNIIPPQMVAAEDTRITSRVALRGTLPTDSQNSSSIENVSVVDNVNPSMRHPSLVRSVKRNRNPENAAVETR